MKSIILLLCLIACYYCLNITKVSINTRTSIPTNNYYPGKMNYFYLTNSEYYSYSNYIYFTLEDNGFKIFGESIKYCITNTDPNSYSESDIKKCNFTEVTLYGCLTYKGTKYYYMLPTNNSYIYTIFTYNGIYSYRNLYITSNYQESFPSVQITEVSNNTRTSLPTITSIDNFFDLTNNDYISDSMIYILLEDDGFSLKTYSTSFCLSNKYKS